MYSWRIPEHYTADWQVTPDYNADKPADPFRPFGITPGHGLEWARLMLQARGALAALGDEPPSWMLPSAAALFDAAVRDGWHVDGEPGFVYTTDFDGAPIVRERMHWVLCEAVGAGVVLGRIIDEGAAAAATLPDGLSAARLSRDVATWLDYARQYLIEAPGRWFHELDAANVVSTRTWPGKPDAYHVAQLLLLPTVPTSESFAKALRDRLA